LPAYREIVEAVTEKHLAGAKKVLEVGCGRGFFTKWIAPNWLKGKIVSFDINAALLSEAPKEGNFFQGSIYQLPIKTEQLDAIIGLSSFDSFLFLTKVLRETKKTLKPGGKMIFFQDLGTVLYEDEEKWKEDPIKEVQASAEKHWEDLANDLKREGFRVIEGEESPVTAMGVEKASDIRARLDAQIPDVDFPIFVIGKLGYNVPLLSRRSMVEARIPEKAAQEWFDPKTHKNIRKALSRDLKKAGIKAGAGDVVEVLQLRYLVAEKV